MNDNLNDYEKRLASEEQFFEDMAKECPELMQKAQIEYFSVGEGWRQILKILCQLISSDVDTARRRLFWAKESALAGKDDHVAEAEGDYTKARDELPIIVQVKEKFGGLRFYVHNGNERVHSYINFAEAMSTCTCEICGKPGFIGSVRGWEKTLCDEHQHSTNA